MAQVKMVRAPREKGLIDSLPLLHYHERKAQFGDDVAKWMEALGQHARREFGEIASIFKLGSSAPHYPQPPALSLPAVLAEVDEKLKDYAMKEAMRLGLQEQSKWQSDFKVAKVKVFGLLQEASDDPLALLKEVIVTHLTRGKTEDERKYHALQQMQELRYLVGEPLQEFKTRFDASLVVMQDVGEPVPSSERLALIFIEKMSIGYCAEAVAHYRNGDMSLGSADAAYEFLVEFNYRAPRPVHARVSHTNVAGSVDEDHEQAKYASMPFVSSRRVRPRRGRVSGSGRRTLNSTLMDSFEFQKLEVGLDTLATEHILRDDELAQHVSATQPMEISGIQATAVPKIVSLAGETVFGLAYICKDVTANVLSMGKPRADGYSAHYDEAEDEFKVAAGGHTLTFKRRTDEIYTCIVLNKAVFRYYHRDLDNFPHTPRQAFIATTSTDPELTEHWQSKLTQREVKRAANVQQLARRLAFPSSRHLLKDIRSGALLNAGVTARDVENAMHLWGPDLAIIKGKSTGHRSPALPESAATPPGSVQVLHTDLMFLGSRVFVVSVMKPAQYIYASPISNRSAAEIGNALRKQLAHAYTHRTKIEELRSDREAGIVAIVTQLMNEGIIPEFTAATEAVPSAERAIRTLKERVRCIVTGRKPDAERDLRLEFGAYAQVHRAKTSNTMEPRTVRCISLHGTESLEILRARDRWDNSPPTLDLAAHSTGDNELDTCTYADQAPYEGAPGLQDDNPASFTSDHGPPPESGIAPLICEAVNYENDIVLDENPSVQPYTMPTISSVPLDTVEDIMQIDCSPPPKSLNRLRVGDTGISSSEGIVEEGAARAVSENNTQRVQQPDDDLSPLRPTIQVADAHKNSPAPPAINSNEEPSPSRRMRDIDTRLQELNNRE
ncbi:hypothetical protein FVE85_7772 [Porphyridium purpureum]|uniref:Integrase catalytic domain-containing protein n=1 Tax=Porphyridium purpureum TaxID=35688 RepID=A0A5J4YIS3_PORPP|nr:hypothetical protein FVE85_7772 [Porphyridium purpureum]|eukprot:POR8972..scf210_14